MARKTDTSAPPRPAELTAEQLRSAIVKLDRRIAELKAINTGSIPDFGDEATKLTNKINATLQDVFGPDTLEFATYSVSWSSFVRMVIGDTSRYEELRAFERGVQSTLATLESARDIMRERLEDSADFGPNRALRAYQDLDLHSEIARAASDLYKNGHYANAIEDAVKALNNLVRLRSGEALDGTALMERVFSPKAPVLRFNALADQTDADEQKGFMMMFSGAVAGLRNPRAHKLMNDDPERALEFIAFISLLAKLLDGAKR